MKPILLLLILSCLGGLCRSQIIDDFSDGNFYENPTWFGNDSLFIINEDNKLQLNADESGIACLSTYYEKEDEMEWRFWIKEKFSPSANNYCDVFLCSDNPDLKTANQAYILRFGESGSNDVVELLRLNNGQLTSICRGSDTFIASSFSSFVKVTYDKSNIWKIFIDKKGEDVYKLEANGFDGDFQHLDKEASFGFKCTYTNSNVKQFYFDNIYIGKKIIDSIAPELISCEVIDDYHLELKFTEAVSENYALDTNNYIIENLSINPLKVIYGNNYSTIVLEFKEAIQEEIYLNLKIEKIEDFEGNVSETMNKTFLYYKANQYDIVINEIMSDPSPPIELPEYEYVELYNNSAFPINLNHWTFVIGNTEHITKKNIEIQSGEYLLLCHKDATEAFSDSGRFIGLDSFQVTNSGTSLSLLDKKGDVISSVEFDVSWHDDSYKKDGGWSLEQIDYENPCAGKANWRSSCDKMGGTPGRENSVKTTNIIVPEIEHINTVSNNKIEVFFNQNMNLKSLQDTENYFIKEMKLHPSEIFILPNRYDYAELFFEQYFSENELYTLNISDVNNCKDIGLEDIDITFGIPSQVECNDVIINEILFNPITPGVDYVELYNRSDKVVDLSKILLGNIKESFPNPPDTILKEISSDSRIFLPHSYILLSVDGEIVKSQYDTESKNFIDLESFPSLPNEEGRVIICNKVKEIIDEVYYSDKMHYDLLTETKGVALERISFDNPSSDENNWHSASFDVNYGTPGYKNSMSADYVKTDEEIVSIIPEIFSPDGDGFDDNCAIFYELKENASSINIKIFNTKGFLIKNILNNSLTDREGFLIWNGCDDNNHRVEPGIYIVQVELFDLKGNVDRTRKVVVVATK
ncbi:MAG: lamin tail domain-containing protein [Bacteroidales bacterium]|nr:lamin tail domain-containing protein [Bacteroidales bacterium]